jgi:hypothetical protein
MVIRLFFLFMGLFVQLHAADDSEISASVENNTAIEKIPITGLITITHPKEQMVDLHAFKMENTALPVNLIREDTIGNLVVSIYRFRLDPKPKGLYLLPAITVSIRGKSFTSIPVSYEVKAPSRPVVESPEKTLFRLEALYEGPSPLHMGERGLLIYRIYFNKSLDLRLSTLPFVEQKDFRQIGDVDVEEKQEGDISFQEIKVAIEAIKAGSFTYGPAILEGVVYQTNIHGEKEQTETVRAEAPPITVVVIPFPANQIPLSFNGAVGEFSIKTSIVGSSEVYVGDQVQVLVTISGQGTLSETRLPNLLCQPGFSGLFHQNNLPPAGKVNGDTKEFTLLLRPRSTLIKEIPSIEFSYFNPEKKQYIRLKTTSLPLTIKALPETVAKPEQANDIAQGEWRASLNHVPPTDIKGIEFIPPQNLHQQILGIWVIFIIPIGAILVWLQIWWQEHRAFLRKHRPGVSSQSVFSKALALKQDPDKMLQGISQAFLLRLQEKAAIDDSSIAPEEIPNHGLCKDVRDFLCHLEAIRFGNVTPPSWTDLADQAKTLFEKF